jgi:putative cell wall-binding protein
MVSGTGGSLPMRPAEGSSVRYRGLVGGMLIALVLTLVQMTGITPAGAAEADTDIVVVGGSAVIPDDMVTHLDSCSPNGVTRISGSDRYATAAEISNSWSTTDTVFLATGLNYPDALGGGPVAALNNSPILLTQKNAVPGATNAALHRLSPSRVVLLGGTAVISTTVENDLRSRYPEVIRLAGSDRYATAAAVSKWHFTDGASTVYVATGLNYLDALVAGPRAAAENAPLLLVTSTTVPGATATELDRLNPDRIVLVGSAGVVGDNVKTELSRFAADGVTRVAGSSRYSTAAAIAAQSSGNGVFVVTSNDFPDGLAATPATHGAPIVFASTSQMNATTADAIAARTGTGCAPWVPPYPQIGSGKRIIYSNSAQRIWMIDANENLVDTYLVSGRVGIPHYATYSVFSKSVNAWAPYGGITMKYMVRFVRPNTWGNQWSYGFHSIPRYSNGQPMQTEAELGVHRSGGCVRQADAKAYALYQWANIGTTVHAIP